MNLVIHVVVICTLFYASLLPLLKFNFNERKTIVTNNCLALVPGSHISCDDPIVPDAINTTTGRCFPAEKNRPGFCIKCNKIISTSLENLGKTSEKCVLLDLDGKEIPPDR